MFESGMLSKEGHIFWGEIKLTHVEGGKDGRLLRNNPLSWLERYDRLVALCSFQNWEVSTKWVAAGMRELIQIAVKDQVEDENC